MISINILILLVVGSLLILIVSLLKLLYQFFTEKRPSKRFYLGGKRVNPSIGNYVPFVPISINRNLLASVVQPVPGKQQASVKMNSFSNKADRLKQFMMMKGLLDCMKIIKKPTRKSVDYSDSDSSS